MTKFNKFLNSLKTPANASLIETIQKGYNVLFESVAPIVYHNTNLTNAASILKNNEFILSTSTKNDHKLNGVKIRPFYLSTSRIKYGGFARNIYGGYARNRSVVNLVLDGNKLNQKYKGVPVDYLKHVDTRKNLPPEEREKQRNDILAYDENEDRVLSYKRTIEPASKYIKEIHVLIGNLQNDPIYDPINLIEFIKIIEQKAKNLNIPVFFYTDLEAWKVLDKRKASTDLSDISHPQYPTPIPKHPQNSLNHLQV